MNRPELTEPTGLSRPEPSMVLGCMEREVEWEVKAGDPLPGRAVVPGIAGGGRREWGRANGGVVTRFYILKNYIKRFYNAVLHA